LATSALDRHVQAEESIVHERTHSFHDSLTTSALVSFMVGRTNSSRY